MVGGMNALWWLSGDRSSSRFAGAERRTGRAAEDVRAAARVLSQTAVELSRFAAGRGVGRALWGSYAAPADGKGASQGAGRGDRGCAAPRPGTGERGAVDVRLPRDRREWSGGPAALSGGTRRRGDREGCGSAVRSVGVIVGVRVVMAGR